MIFPPFRKRSFPACRMFALHSNLHSWLQADDAKIVVLPAWNVFELTQDSEFYWRPN